MNVLESKYAMNQEVVLALQFKEPVISCTVKAIKFWSDEILYDVWIEFKNGDYCKMKEVHERFLSEAAHKPENA